MPRQTSKSIDSWAALLAKELAPAKKTEGGKTLSEIREMRRKMKLASGRTQTRIFIRAQIKAGLLKQVDVYERNEKGEKLRSAYYVPTK